MRRLLIHTCKYCARGTPDRNGAVIYTETTLERVRLVPVEKTVLNATGESKDDKLTLYIVPGISAPDTTPQELDRVTWGGKNYTIREVRPCYTKDAAAVHHYEVALT